MRVVARQVATVVVFEIPIGEHAPAEWLEPGHGRPGAAACWTASSPSRSRSATGPPPSSWAPATCCRPRRPAGDDLLEHHRELARPRAGARRRARRRLRRARAAVAADRPGPPAPRGQARRGPRRPARHRLPAAARGPPGAACCGTSPRAGARSSWAASASRSRSPTGCSGSSSAPSAHRSPTRSRASPRPSSSPAAATSGTCTARSSTTSRCFAERGHPVAPRRPRAAVARAGPRVMLHASSPRASGAASASWSTWCG